MIRLSIVVPTIGRTTLAQTLDSLVHQLGPRDEAIVVADGTGDPRAVSAVVGGLDDPRVRFAEHYLPLTPGVGNGPRLTGMRLAQGTHLLFMDDDDVYVPGALRLLRAAAGERPVIFRMDATAVGLGTLWDEPALTYANVGTPMFIVPNRPVLFGEWAPHNERGEGSDFTFITGCCERMGDPLWRDDVVAVVRPGPEWAERRLQDEQSAA